MTHSLHRDGNNESLHDDYVMLVLVSPDRAGDPDVKRGMAEVWDILASRSQDLANFGTIRGGGRHRKSIEDFKEQGGFMIHAVFKDKGGMESALHEIKERRLGLSVTVSGLYKEVGQACAGMGLTPHTVQYSLGVLGKTDLLPDENVLEIMTMCGHAMVSPRLLQHLLNRVRSNKMSHRDAALELSRQCECGIFNPERAERLLRNMTCACPSTEP
jgi:hypothetical protein